VLERIQGDQTISEPLRQRALKLAETDQFILDAHAFNEGSWSVVSRSNASPDEYAVALRRIQAAVR